MDKDSTTSHGGLPPTGRFPGFNVKSEPSDEVISSFPVPPPASDFSMFSHDLSRMTDNPQKNIGHRRAHSEILTLPDDITFDSDLGVVGAASDETEEDLFSMYLDMDKVNSSSATSSFQSEPPELGNVGGEGSVGRPRIRHQHSQSMDGSTTIKPEMLVSGGEETSAADARKAMSAAKLAELALVDPKRAKRIWANRQSAARSKERKMRYIAELERRLQALQTEATTLSAQLSLLQRDTNGLSSENSELKVRLQTMDQQIHLQDALNDALKDEIQHLKMLTGQAMPNAPSSYVGSQSLYSNSNQQQQAMQTLLTAQQFQQLQIQSQKQHQLQQLHQQLQQQQQQQQQQEQQFRGSLPSPSLRENTPDLMSLGQKD